MSSEERRKVDVELRIQETLQEFGMDLSRLGCQYLKEAIQIVYERPETIHNFRNEISEPIAKMYGKTIETIGSSLNATIRLICKKSSSKVFEKYFGKTLCNCYKAPFNVDIISVLAEYMHIQDNPQELESRISKFLIDVGIFPSKKGFKYLREAIKMTYDEPTIVYDMHFKIHIPLAKKYESNIRAVYSCMTTAIESAWDRGNYTIVFEYFGNIESSERIVPTSGKFIKSVVEYLHAEETKIG